MIELLIVALLYIKDINTYNVYIPIINYAKTYPRLGVWIDGFASQQFDYVVPDSIIEISTLYNPPINVQALKDYHLILGVHEINPERYALWATFHPEYIEVLNLGFYNEPQVYMSPGEYAKLLDSVYYRIKTVSPDTIVIAGALIRPDDGWWLEVQSLTDNYDAVSFHYYQRWPNLDYSGVCEQANYLHNLTSKPIYLTETAIRCTEDCNDNFNLAQIDWLNYLYNNSCDIDMVLWYTVANNLWEHTDMVEDDYKLPVWYAYEELLK